MAVTEAEVLTLVAQVKDLTSGPVREMTKALRQLTGVAKETHEGGREVAEKHTKAYTELGKQMGQVTRTAVDVLQPGLAMLGVEAFTVTGAILAVTSAVKNFGEAGETLAFTARKSGATIGMIRALGDAGERFGVSQETMNAGLSKFGAFMDQNARRAPDALNAWNAMPGAWARIGKSLIGLNRDAQINKVLDFIPSMKFMDQRRKLLNMLGLPEDWANLTKEESQKIRAAGREFNRLHPMAIENAMKAKEAWDAIASSLKGIRDDMGAAFGPSVVEGIKALHEFFDDKSTIDAFKASFGTVADIIHKAFVSTKKDIEDITAVLKFIEKISDKFEKFFSGGSGYKANPFADLLRGKMPEKNLVPEGSPLDLSDPKKAKEPIKEGTKEGVKEGLKEFQDNLKAGNNSYVPMAYHPGGGGLGGGMFGSKEFPAVGGEAGGAAPLSGSRGRARLGVGVGGGRTETGETPAGSGPAGGKLTGSRQQIASIAAEEWKRAGMPDTGTAGVMANVNEESRFNPTLRHPDQPKFGGEAHFAHGLYQEGGTEWNHFAAWMKKNHAGEDWRDPRLQSRFAAENLKQNYPKVWERMKNATSREEAAAAYTSGYLKPAKQYELSRIAGFRRHGVPPLESFTGPAGAHGNTGAHLRDHIRGGHRDTNHHLSIDFNGMPKGTRTAYKGDAGLFKEVKLNRGRPMGVADQ